MKTSAIIPSSYRDVLIDRAHDGPTKETSRKFMESSRERGAILQLRIIEQDICQQHSRRIEINGKKNHRAVEFQNRESSENALAGISRGYFAVA